MARPAVPREPIAALLDAFRTHQVVALGEGTEGNIQGHAFRLALIHEPKFAAAVNDIVIECGNARYQDLIDRFVGGDEVPYDSLRRVWQNTTQPDTIWDVPIYEEFLRAVRSVNASLPKERQLRVLLGDPPIDWDSIHTAKEYGRWDRDGYPAELIRREVLAKGRRALVIYGDLHLIRKSPRKLEKGDDWAYSIVGLLEKTSATEVFSIHTIAYGMDLEKLQADVLSWPRPSLAMLRGTVLGAASFSNYYPQPLVAATDGKPDASPEQRRPLRMEEQFDALLYLGPQSSITRAQLSPKLCADTTYLKMRLGRMAMLGMQEGIDRLKNYCALKASSPPIEDREPALTQLVRDTISEAASGRTDPSRFAPESRQRLVGFLQRNGPRFMGSIGALDSLSLLKESEDAGKHVRIYQAAFGRGAKIIWSVGFSRQGKILSLVPRRE